MGNATNCKIFENLDYKHNLDISFSECNLPIGKINIPLE